MLKDVIQVVDLCGDSGSLPESSTPLRAVLADSVGSLLQTVLGCQCGVSGVDELVEVCLVCLPVRLQVTDLSNHVGVGASEADVAVLLGSDPGDVAQREGHFHISWLDCDSADGCSEA